LLKNECETYSHKLNIMEFEFSKKLESEQLKSKESLANKEKHYEEFIADLDKKHMQKLELDRVKIENLLAELENLRSQQVVKAQSLFTSSAQLEPENDLKKQNQQLIKQLEELKFSYDDLNDEKQQLFMSLNELKQKQLIASSNQSNETIELNQTIKQLNQKLSDKERQIQALESKLTNSEENFSKFVVKKSNSNNVLNYTNNYKMPSSNLDRSLMTELSDQETSRLSNSQCLEPTEVDYLRSIIYSYMMGTDPIVIHFYFLLIKLFFLFKIKIKNFIFLLFKTMAKVIVAVLKFPDDEKRKIIENEKQKNSSYLFSIGK
jgi:hypothetical protein